MFQIKYNNEFFDIEDNQDSELEANSPLFLIDNLLNEISTPFTFKYSDKNVRMIGAVFFSTSVKRKIKLPVEVYKFNSFRCNATLVIESAAIRRSARNASASGYLLTGISAFFSLIKDQLCTSMNIGSWTKDYTTYHPYDGTDGYWQAFVQSWDGSMDFICAPIRNDNLNNDAPTDFMNKIGRDMTYIGNNDSPYYTYSDKNWIAGPITPVYPQLFLKVAFKNIFESVGWTLDYSMIPDFEKIVLFSNFKVETYNIESNPDPALPQGVKRTITFQYANLLPKNVNTSSFILAICKRYGWVPLCSAETKHCVLFPLKDSDTGTLKDWTIYADPDYDSDFSEDDNIYSFKNNFTGNDAIPSDPDISELDQSLVVDSRFNLPAASEVYDNSAVFCCRENAWYGIILDENNNRTWAPVKDNIYNDEVDGSNSDVETDCTTLAMTWNQYTFDATDQYWGLFPYCSQPSGSEAGIRTLIYHGLVKEQLTDGSPGLAEYPFLSSTRELPDGTIGTAWSNVFKFKSTDGNYYDIENYWYKTWINYMKYPEVKTQNFTIPLRELLKFQWTDRILINNIPHLVISYIEKLSQMDKKTSRTFIQAKLKRLIKE